MANGTSLGSGRIGEIGPGGLLVTGVGLAGHMFAVNGHQRRELTTLSLTFS